MFAAEVRYSSPPSPVWPGCFSPCDYPSVCFRHSLSICSGGPVATPAVRFYEHSPLKRAHGISICPSVSLKLCLQPELAFHAAAGNTRILWARGRIGYLHRVNRNFHSFTLDASRNLHFTYVYVASNSATLAQVLNIIHTSTVSIKI